MTVKVLWVVFGLVPAALFITGGITWWARVVRQRSADTVANRALETVSPLAEEGVQN